MIRLRDDRGQIVLAALALLVLLIFTTGFTLDLARGLVYRVRAATAAEAAALAAAASGRWTVQAEATLYYLQQEVVGFAGRPPQPVYAWVPRQRQETYTGREKDFPAWFAAWTQAMKEWCQVPDRLFQRTEYRVLARWVEYDRDAKDAAEGFYWANSASLGRLGVTVDAPQVVLDGGRGRPGTVSVSGGFSFPTILLRAFGLDRIPLRVWAEGYPMIRHVPDTGISL